MIDLDAFDVLTFDCYGTLIDWETGILAGLRAALGDAIADVPDAELLAAFARHEHEAEVPYTGYREVLGLTLRALAAERGLPSSAAAEAAFGASVADWPAFPDSHDALVRLQERFRLVVITNCDDDLFAASEERLGVRFDEVVTAQQLGSYKPDVRNFHLAHARIAERFGVPATRILHVAQSLFHDHVPAKSIGMTTVWISRRGAGAAPPAEASPDATYPDMAAFAAVAAPAS